MKDRIKKLRESLNLSQAKFGAKIGVGQSTIANYERGLTPLDTVIISICREFGVREEWLRTGKGVMMEEKSRDELLATELDKILTVGDDDFRKRLISLLIRLPPNRWEVLEEIALELSQDTSKKED